MLVPSKFFCWILLLSLSQALNAAVTIRPGQTIEAGGIQVSCTASNGGDKIVKPKPIPKATFEIFYCARVSKNFVLKKNRYQLDGKLVSDGIEVFQADNKADCYNSLKERSQPVPRSWNFSCACDVKTWGYGNKEDVLVKKVYGPEGLIGAIELESGQWDKHDPVCSEKLAFTRANDPTCY